MQKKFIRKSKTGLFSYKNLKRRNFVCPSCGEELQRGKLDIWKYKCIICNRIYDLEQLNNEVDINGIW